MTPSAWDRWFLAVMLTATEGAVVLVLTEIGQGHAAHALLNLVVLSGLSVATAKGTKTMTRMTRWSAPLGPDEVGIVTGLWRAGRARVLLTGRVLLIGDQRMERLATSVCPVTFDVSCQSADDWPVTITMKTAFRIPRDVAAIEAVSDRFGTDTARIQQYVVDCFQPRIREVASRYRIGQINKEAAALAAAATDLALPQIRTIGVESDPLAVAQVTVSPKWRTEKEKQAELQTRLGTVRLQNEIDDRTSAAIARRDAEARREGERAKADAYLYAEEQRVKAAREHMLLEDEKRERDRRHGREMAELEAFRLWKSLEVRDQYQETIIREKLVDKLEKILEAKGKLLPNLRTYIASARESDTHNGLLDLITGMSTFGPDIMQELQNLISSLHGQSPKPLPTPAPPKPIADPADATTESDPADDPDHPPAAEQPE